jgi:hypothetical protein
MRIGETQQLISLAPPRIDSTLSFYLDMVQLTGQLEIQHESWDQWVNRNGMKEDGMAVTRVAPSEGTSLDSLNLTKIRVQLLFPSESLWIGQSRQHIL